jgi:hypothetical protein
MCGPWSVTFDPGASTGADKDVAFARGEQIPILTVEDSLGLEETDKVLASEAVTDLRSWARTRQAR